MKGRLAFLLVLSMLLSCFSFTGASRSETEILPTYPVHDVNTGLNYATIQEAIDRANPGDTIKVDAGIYYEHVIISQAIRLVGEASESTIIDGNGTGDVVEIESGNVGIYGFSVQNAGQNFRLPSQTGQSFIIDTCIKGNFVQNVDIENNIVLNAAACLVFGGSSSVNISNNTISNATIMGVDIGYYTRNLTLSNNFIHDYGILGINFDGDSRYCGIINNTVENGFAGIGIGPNRNTLLFPADNLIDGNILSNNSGVNLAVDDHGGTQQESCTNVFRRNKLTNLQHYNLLVWGDDLSSFMQDIDTSNLANGKRICYITNVNGLEVDPSSYPDAGYLALVNCSNVTVKDFDFVANNDGLLLAGVTNCTLTNMTLGDNRILVTYGNRTETSYWGGLMFFESSNNTMENCMLCNGTFGVWLYRSDRNLFSHNSFIGNDKNVLSNTSTNSWDNGYPSGGNYWSDYNGSDVYSGPYQNETGYDWIGDTPYTIDQNNTDRYPLMYPFVPEIDSTRIAYRSLLSDYNELQTNFTGLNSIYQHQLSDYTELQANYTSLQNSYSSLQTNFVSLNSSYSSLRSNFNLLNSSYNSLNTTVNEYKESTQNELSYTRNLVYVLTTTTLILAVAVVYLVMKKPKTKSEAR
jgi:parallel beta-helix repeat protein